METLTEVKNNVQRVQQAYADFGSGNIQGILDVCADDIVWRSYENPEVPIAGTFNEKKGVAQFFQLLAENIDYSLFEPREFFSDNETVVVLGRHAGTVKKTGKSYDHDWCMVFRFRNEKLLHYFVFVDTLAQAETFKP